MKVIFSTKHIGPDYTFSKEKSLISDHAFGLLENDFLLNEYFQKQVQKVIQLTDDAMKDELLKKYEGNDINDYIGDEYSWSDCIPADFLFRKAFLVLLKDKKEKLDVLWRNKGVEERIIDTLDRFNYYTTEDGQDTSLCAVHCLPGASGSIEWVGALIEDAVSENLGTDEEKTLYLLLHDKDVPGYEEQTFRVLNSNEVKEILKAYLEVSSKEEDLEKVELGDKECKEKEGEWFYKEWKIKILVFNHVTNAAVALTRKKGCTANEIVSQVKEIFENKMGEFFDGASDNLQAKKSRFSGLSLDGYVDLCNREIKDELFEEKRLSDNRKYYVYKDNGALVTELMHVRTDVKAAIQFKRLVGIALNQNKFPIIICVYKSFFDDWATAVSSDEDKKKIRNHHNKKAMEENLERVFSFFNNSSIWIRLVEINDEKEYQKAVADFKYFDEIGLYNYDSAWENLGYNCRVFGQNFLESSIGGHGSFVTPMLYGNELVFRDCLTSGEINAMVQKEVDRPHAVKGSVSKSGLDEYHDVTMRLLVIDDKVAAGCSRFPKEDGVDISCVELYETQCCRHGCVNKRCKLKTLSSLMEREIPVDRYQIDISVEGRKSSNMELLDLVCWEEHKIETFVCPTITNDFIQSDIKLDFDRIVLRNKTENKANELKGNDCDKESKIDYCMGEKKNTCIINSVFEPVLSNGSCVQLVGVRDIRTALLLMTQYKFDMVFCDYLLDEDCNGDREYANQLFEFLSHDYSADLKKETDENVQDQLKLLERLQHDVLDNRGPLDKLWIMPITGFNQTFIQDLYRNQVDLIGHKWNISNGADPITTPWQFLYHLNKFIELQLKGCVYDMGNMLRFLQYTCEQVESRSFLEFSDFQAFMGFENANFMRRYGARQIIMRDAQLTEGKGVDANKSLFATYVWDNFYKNPEKRDVIELNRLIQRFLHQASVMHNDRTGQQRLEETFGQLCFYIAANRKVQERIKNDEELQELQTKLRSLRQQIDRLTGE